MLNQQIDYFENFEKLNLADKQDLIINQLIIQGYYPAQAQLDLAAWKKIDTQKKLAILKFVFSAPIFHVSGMKFLDEVSIVDLWTVTRYSTRFFAKFALAPLIDEVFKSDDSKIIDDFLHSIALNQSLVNGLPSRKDLLKNQNHIHLNKMLSRSFAKLDSDAMAIEMAAKCLNVNFILLILELRQDLKVLIPDFMQTICEAINIIVYDEEHEHTARMKFIEEIQKWLESNKNTSIESQLLYELLNLKRKLHEKTAENLECIQKESSKRQKLTI